MRENKFIILGSMFYIREMMRIWAILYMIIILLACQNIKAGDLRKVFSLSGKWKFSVGDKKEWISPGFNDNSWDEVIVPGRWEDQGYEGYNGYAWYRKTFIIPEISPSEQIYLRIGRIDDVDEVYINGKLLNRTGSFPPEYSTAYNIERQYSLPKEFLKINGENTIAIKVYDNYLEGGIVDGQVGIYIDEDNSYLDLIITGKWKFHTGDNKEWANPKFNDKEWVSLDVPRDWESQGFQDYDGYAWYRRKFNVPQGFINGDLYLSLGKIDDLDYVYLNGKLIGKVFDLDNDSEYRRKGFEYNARRVYKIPKDLLKENSINILAVRVYDGQWRGGIYEGPIGIMKEKKYRAYYRKNHRNQSFLDYIIDEYSVNY